MRHDEHPPAASSGANLRAFGTETLPPVLYSMCVRSGEKGQVASNVEWVVREFVLEEACHEPYQFEVIAIARGGEADLDGLLRSRLDLEIVRGDDVRVIHGVVLRAELLADIGDGVRVALRCGPAVELLGFGRRCRVFQGLSVVEIAEAVLGSTLTAYGSALCVDELVGSYPPRDYCVQYRESDLGFMLRILADEGITMLFDHSEDTETVVLVDDNQSLPPAGIEPLEEAAEFVQGLPYVPKHAGQVPVESIQAMAQGQQLIRGRWTTSIWTWKDRPRVSSSTVSSDEIVRSGESWCEVDEGRPSEGSDCDEPIHDASSRRAQLLRRRDETHELHLWGQTNATVLRAGSVFELTGAPHRELSSVWMVNRVSHKGTVPDATVYSLDREAGPQYTNEIECQPHSVPMVPERRPRPIAQGVHTAVVTGPEGETIYTDRFGRIRVRMLWDEQEHEEEETSCWLRVAMPWAGDRFGTVFIPRVGTEVVVSFVDGDPDRPLCTGSVYDGANLPPYELPEDRTRTVLRTANTDGEGFHELSFEDGSGQEEVYLHAQRKLREVVRGHHSTSVDASQRTWIGGSRTTSIGKDDLLQVSGDQSRTVDGSLTKRVRGAMRLFVSEAPKEMTGIKGLGIAVEQGSVDIEAKDAIVLRCGACQLEIQPNKIVLSGPEIVLQCPSQTADHPTSMAMTEEGIETTTDRLRQHTVDAQLVADTRVVLGTGPDMSGTTLDLVEGHAKLHAGHTIEVRADVLTAEGSGPVTIKGSTCTVGGQTVDVRGGRIGLEAEARLEISTPGQVNIRGQEKISLN